MASISWWEVSRVKSFSHMSILFMYSIASSSFFSCNMSCLRLESAGREVIAHFFSLFVFTRFPVWFVSTFSSSICCPSWLVFKIVGGILFDMWVLFDVSWPSALRKIWPRCPILPLTGRSPDDVMIKEILGLHLHHGNRSMAFSSNSIASKFHPRARNSSTSCNPTTFWLLPLLAIEPKSFLRTVSPGNPHHSYLSLNYPSHHH